MNWPVQCVLRLTDRSEVPQPRKAVLRKISDPLTRDTIDHSLVLWFPGSERVCVGEREREKVCVLCQPHTVSLERIVQSSMCTVAHQLY